jgi:hypothetical protein
MGLSAVMTGGCGTEEQTATDIEAEQKALVTIPSGFYNILSATGVNVYQKDYSGGQPDYVTVVDLRYGSISNLTGTPSGNAGAKLISKKLLSAFWSDAVAANTGTKTAKVVLNGVVFDTNSNPTGIAYGVKVAGTTLNYGYASGEYPGYLRIFMFDSAVSKVCSIVNYDKPNFPTTYNSSTPDGAGTVDPGANFAGQQNSWIQRTFVGVADQSGDGVPETALFYGSKLATQASAKAILQAFGAQSVAMFDGGGSTCLIVNGTAKISTTRTIPHAIAVYAGK